MYHRKVEKYKEFEGQENVVYRKAELLKVKTKDKEGWIALDGRIITDYLEALEYAKRVNELYDKLYIAKCTNRNKV